MLEIWLMEHLWNNKVSIMRPEGWKLPRKLFFLEKWPIFSVSTNQDRRCKSSNLKIYTYIFGCSHYYFLSQCRNEILFLNVVQKAFFVLIVTGADIL